MLKHVLRAGIGCAFIALSGLVGGCDNSSEAGSAKGSYFSFINRNDIITLDLNQMSYLQDFRVTYALREGLFSYDPSTPTFEPRPALAIETVTSDDKLVWTFKLREDAKWSNGDPVTAKDFVFSWRLMLQSPGEYTSLFYKIRNAEAYEKAYLAGTPMADSELGVEATGEYSLKVTLSDPVPFLPDLLAFPPFYPRHAASMEPFKSINDGKVTYEAKYTRPEHVVVNGPYVLSTWEPGKRLLLKKSPTYWDRQNVKTDTVEMVVNNDPQSAFIQYENGKIDWLADVSPEIASKLREANRSDLRVSTAYGTAFLTLNVAESVPGVVNGKNPLSDLRVRKAMAMAIDKQYVVEKITRMGEKTADSYVPPGFFEGYQSTPAPGYDLEQAKRLLAEAGYADAKGFPTLSIAYNSDNPTRKALSEFLAQSWQSTLGIRVELTPLEMKTYRDKITTKQYTLGCVSWYGDYMDLTTWTDKYMSNSLNNDTNWGPKAYDDLCIAANAERDEQKRMALLQQAEAMINTELPIIPVYYYVNVTLHRDNVKGIIPNAKNILVWKEVFVDR